jgi:3'-phosphoadenosine 5'-phosphosulfate sulfotransferase
MSTRVRDFALLIGHAWRCTRCRETLLEAPTAAWVGFKLDDEQRECILSLTDESFHTVTKLAELTNLTVRELDEAIDHPRARLRHLAGNRYDFQFARYS